MLHDTFHEIFACLCFPRFSLKVPAVSHWLHCSVWVGGGCMTRMLCHLAAPPWVQYTAAGEGSCACGMCFSAFPTQSRRMVCHDMGIAQILVETISCFSQWMRNAGEEVPCRVRFCWKWRESFKASSHESSCDTRWQPQFDAACNCPLQQSWPVSERLEQVKWEVKGQRRDDVLILHNSPHFSSCRGIYNTTKTPSIPFQSHTRSWNFQINESLQEL